MKTKICPKCGKTTSRLWTTGRKFIDHCSYSTFDNSDNEWACNWESKPYLPEKKKVETTATFHPACSGGWKFELFDGRGHTLMLSKGYASLKECEDAAKAEVDNHERFSIYGKCTAVIFPRSVEVKALKVIVSEKAKK